MPTIGEHLRHGLLALGQQLEHLDPHRMPDRR
jgi:hypothetical protein